MQKANRHSFIDSIHHPGLISEVAVAHFMERFAQMQKRLALIRQHAAASLRPAGARLKFVCPRKEDVVPRNLARHGVPGFSDHYAGLLSAFAYSLMKNVTFQFDCPQFERFSLNKNYTVAVNLHTTDNKVHVRSAVTHVAHDAREHAIRFRYSYANTTSM